MARVVTGDEAKLIVNLSYNIRYMIRDKNTTAAAVARKAGISQSKMYSYTKGCPVLDYKVVEKIANVLECTVYDLTKEYDPSMHLNED